MTEATAKKRKFIEDEESSQRKLSIESANIDEESVATKSCNRSLELQICAFGEKKQPNSTEDSCDTTMRINVKYLCDDGRRLILKHAVKVYYDFGDLSKFLCVSILKKHAHILKSSPDVEWDDENDGGITYLPYGGPPLNKEDAEAIGRSA